MLPRALLLPGMHGTAALFDGLLRASADRLALRTVEYPQDGPQDYASLQQAVATQLPTDGEPFALIAESFGGPLALRLAAATPPGLTALVLVNSFVRAPMSPVLGLGASFGVPLASRMGVPASVVRKRMLGGDSPDTLVRQTREVISAVPRATLAARMRVVATANETRAYLATQLPIFYLRSDADRLVPDSAVHTLIRTRPGLQVVHTPGPHLLLQRHPQRSAELLERCLTERG